MEPATLCIVKPSPQRGAAGGSPGLEVAASAFQEARPHGQDDVDRWCDGFAGPAEHAELFRAIHRARPLAAERLAQAVTQMPEAGMSFEGFRLVQELGRGAFGRVFLAHQGDLAGRPVVLKVAADVFGESQTLAQLQHTNIVPVYSVHHCGPLQAVCMPYLGSTTLADLLKQLLSQQELPHSGVALVSTVFNRKSLTRIGLESSTGSTVTVAQTPAESSAANEVPQTDPGDRTPPILAMLEGLDYVRAVLWVASRIADGLAHAHELGILHRDLKPANVLLSDEGQPMLLDFGVAEDTKLGAGVAAALVGGTLPYMAPEHLDACRGGKGPVTPQSDLYSLGVILFELLAGRYPFPVVHGASAQDIPQMIAYRSGPAPSVRRWNPEVSPAVDAIVRHCLEPDPGKRYQSARHLQEDLQRQLQDQPLRYAPEPSLGERARKWVRRHPRLTSSISVALLAGVLLLGLGAWAVQRNLRLAELEATQLLGQFRDEARSAQLLLNVRSDERRQLEEGLAHGQRALDLYGVLDGPNWQARPVVRRLPAGDQASLREEVGELLLLLARGKSLNGSGAAGPTGAGEPLQLALDLNRRAEALAPDGKPSRALLSQRAELTRLLGRLDEAQALQKKAEQTPLLTTRDRYLAAAEHSVRGRYREALPLLQLAVDEDPQSFWSWFLLGHCQAKLTRFADAAANYNAAIALWPEYSWAYFNRGLVYLWQSNHRRAVADFDRAIRLRPEPIEPYLNRAIARQGLGDYAGAIADLTHVLGQEPECTRAYFMRARARELAGDAAGARRDRDEGMHHEPTDEHGWLARGIARMAADPPGALADFEKALEFNPRSLIALQNRAHLLGRTGRAKEAAATLDRAVALYPDYVPARSGRGVYRARLHQRTGALEDAREALLRDTSPAITYQVAGIYALTSRENAEDRPEAFRLLATALRGGFGFDLLEIDRDLDPIRQEPEFQRLVQAAQAVRTKSPGK